MTIFVINMLTFLNFWHTIIDIAKGVPFAIFLYHRNVNFYNIGGYRL